MKKLKYYFLNRFYIIKILIKHFCYEKIISLKNIEYAIHEKPILQGVSFRCSIDERMCIFGENGAGKSTLFKILCGQIEPDKGKIQKEGHIRFFYVAQEFDHIFKNKTVEEYIETCAGSTLVKKVIIFAKALGLTVGNVMLKTCDSLSGGQQKALALSVAFAVSPDFILLDEPENHLDIVSRMQLISLMQEFKGGIIFISHDRLLIDTIATKVGELAGGKMHLSEGGYDDYLEMKMERIGGLQRQFDAQEKRIRQLSSSIIILQQKAMRGKEVSAYHKAQEELDRLKKEHKSSGRPEDKKTKIKITQNDHGLHNGKLLCKVEKGSFRYEQAKGYIFYDTDIEMRSGSKIVLLGRNGSGKSTFLKCLMGDLSLSEGVISWGAEVNRAYFNQHAIFDPEQNAIQIVSEQLNCLDTEAQIALGAMKFDSARMNTPTKNLSGGERMRIRFAIVFGRKPDFIILDEPTNHIDEITWEILLHACINSKSSILLVTHDYEFIKAFNPSVFWLIHDRKVVSRHKELDVLLEEIK